MCVHSCSYTLYIYQKWGASVGCAPRGEYNALLIHTLVELKGDIGIAIINRLACLDHVGVK